MMPKRLTVKLPSGPRPVPEAANFFHLSFSGPDVQLLVGYYDPQSVALQDVSRGSKEELEVEAEITHRFALSGRGLHVLRSQVNAIADEYERAMKTTSPEDLAEERGAKLR